MMINFLVIEILGSIIIGGCICVVLIACEDSRTVNRTHPDKQLIHNQTQSTTDPRVLLTMFFTVITGIAMIGTLTITNWQQNGTTTRAHADQVRITKVRHELPAAIKNAQLITKLTHDNTQTDHPRAVKLVAAEHQKYMLMQLIGRIRNDTKRQLYAKLYDQVYHIKYQEAHWE